MILAIDPGLSGAFALLGEDGSLCLVDDLPTCGDDKQRRIDAVSLADTLSQFSFASGVVEQVHAMPKNGVASMFRFGQAFGTVIGIAASRHIPLHYVTPSKWKRAMGLDNTAEKSRLMAIDLYPSFSAQLKRKGDHNRAEAILLGRWHLLNNRNLIKAA